MAAVGNNNLTYLDLQRRMDPNSAPAIIIEQLAQENEILQDMVVMECNSGINNVTTVRTGLPTGVWRKLNSGVPNDKSQTKQVSDTCGMLESYSEVDKDLVQLSNNPARVRATEDEAFAESFNQTMATTLIYGDTDSDPEKFLGLSPRFDTPASTKTASGYNMIDGGGVGSDNTSIWLVVWGDRTAHGLYPEGLEGTGGFTMNDLGEQTLFDANNYKYQGYRTHYKWNLGFTVRDWRYIVRVCNIDVPALIAASSAADLVRCMIRAVERIQSVSSGRAVWYVNRTVRTYLRTQILEKSNMNLTWETVAGKRVMMFDGIPVRLCEAILNTESQYTTGTPGAASEGFAAV